MPIASTTGSEPYQPSDPRLADAYSPLEFDRALFQVIERFE